MLIAAMGVLLGGCARESFRLVPCGPPFPEYTAAEQLRAGQELEALEEDAALRKFMEDYGVLRVRLRALRRCF